MESTLNFLITKNHKNPEQFSIWFLQILAFDISLNFKSNDWTSQLCWPNKEWIWDVFDFVDIYWKFTKIDCKNIWPLKIIESEFTDFNADGRIYWTSCRVLCQHCGGTLKNWTWLLDLRTMTSCRLLLLCPFFVHLMLRLLCNGGRISQ